MAPAPQACNRGPTQIPAYLPPDLPEPEPEPELFAPDEPDPEDPEELEDDGGLNNVLGVAPRDEPAGTVSGFSPMFVDK